MLNVNTGKLKLFEMVDSNGNELRFYISCFMYL